MSATFDHQILDPAQSRLRLRPDLVVTPHDSLIGFLVASAASLDVAVVGADEPLPPKVRELIAALEQELPAAEAVADRVEAGLRALTTDSKSADSKLSVAIESARLRIEAIRSLRRIIAEQPTYLQFHVTALHLKHWSEAAEFYLAAAQADTDPFAGAVKGVRPVRSPIDGQLLLYRFTLPSGYDPAKKYPLVVDLHSGGGFSWLAGWVDGKPDATPRAASTDGAIHIAPAGRQHVGVGERAILDAIADAQRHYATDRDRVLIGGASYGGTGGFHFGTLLPDRFSAAHTLTGGGNYAVPVGNGRFDAYLLADNLAALPFMIWDTPGDGHYKANHAFADQLRERAEKHPGSYQHLELTDPKGGHGIIDKQLQAEGWSWMHKQVRNPYPKRVVYKSYSLRYDGAYWARIDTFIDPSLPARIEAEVSDGDRLVGVRVTVDNVDRFHLDLAAALVGPVAKVEVWINEPAAGGEPLRVPAGRVAYFAKSGDRWTTVAERYPQGLVKKHGLSGPIQDVFMEHPVLIVHGRSANEERAATERMLDKITDQLVGKGDGSGVLRTGFERKAAGDVNAADIATKNLIIVGTPAQNRFLATLAERLPVSFLDDGVRVDGKDYRGPGVGLVMVYPNPLNPERYILLVPEDYEGGKPWDYPDYVVLQGPATVHAPARSLMRGTFDARWQPIAKTSEKQR